MSNIANYKNHKELYERSEYRSKKKNSIEIEDFLF